MSAEPMQAPGNRTSALYELRQARARTLELWAAVARARDCLVAEAERELLKEAGGDAQLLARRIDRLILRLSRPA
jgi:hypothetical protein